MYCSYILGDNTFSNNIATTEGGCIYDNKYLPANENNIFDSSNYAPYGSAMAGYPFGVRLVSFDNYPIASGQSYSGKIVVEVIDP